MKERLLRWVRGSVRLAVLKGSPERFLNLCCGKNLDVWGLECRKGAYEFHMSIRSFRKVKPLAGKAGIRLKILEKQGLPFFLYRNRKRKLFAAGMAGFFVLIYFLSLFLWDIEFQGNRLYTCETLTDWLKSQQVDFGMYKGAVDCQAIEQGLRACFPEITWVSARVSGTRLLIHIKENQVLSQIPEKEEIPCDLVASSPGVITSMVVRRGTPAAAVGDQVEAGQVLILGQVEIRDDSGAVVRAYRVPADGDVVIQTEKTYEKDISLLRTVRVPTGKRRAGLQLQVGGWSWSFLTPAPEGGSWDYVTQEHQMKLFENFFLPVWVGTIEGRQMSQYQRLSTKEEVEKEAEQINRLFVENLEEKGVQILENNAKIERNAFQCRISARLTVLEPAGEKVPREETPVNHEFEENTAAQ